MKHSRSFSPILVFLLLSGLVRAAPLPPRLLVVPVLPSPQDSPTLLLFDAARVQTGTPPEVLLWRDGQFIARVATRAPRAPDEVQTILLGRLSPGRYSVEYRDVAGPGFAGQDDLPKLTLRFVVSEQGLLSVVEYFNAVLGHYFITAGPVEQQKLDSGTIPGWQRTGETFRALPVDDMPSFGSPVCRFYGLPSAGLDSHFFSADADECAAVESKWPNKWVRETPGAFGTVSASSLYPVQCGGGYFAPVFRLYNNRADANHRYTVSRAIRDQMVAQGWIEEGADYDGPHEERHAMCVPE
jgi:hypothetical protein